jgi:hypothetical protein
VLALLADGLANKRIALELAISEKTVKSHLTNIFGRIGVSDRYEAGARSRPPRAPTMPTLIATSLVRLLADAAFGSCVDVTFDVLIEQQAVFVQAVRRAGDRADIRPMVVVSLLDREPRIGRGQSLGPCLRELGPRIRKSIPLRAVVGAGDRRLDRFGNVP